MKISDLEPSASFGNLMENAVSSAKKNADEYVPSAKRKWENF